MNRVEGWQIIKSEYSMPHPCFFMFPPCNILEHPLQSGLVCEEFTYYKEIVVNPAVT